MLKLIFILIRNFLPKSLREDYELFLIKFEYQALNFCVASFVILSLLLIYRVVFLGYHF